MERDGVFQGSGTNILLFVWMLLTVLPAWAQDMSGGKIVGRVMDDSTNAPIVNANVFLANTMKGTATDTSGYFVLKNVLVGSHELVASCVGYRMASMRIRTGSDSALRVELRLRPRPIDMQLVEVTAPQPEAWKRALDKFTVLLLGSSEEAKACRILNPEVVDLESDGKLHLSAHTDKVLVVLNSALGYRIHLSIANFQEDQGWLSCEWKSRFEELHPSTAEQSEEWQRNRERVFQGSLHHFLISLVHGDLAHAGFVMLSSSSPRFEPKKKDLYFEKSVTDILKQVGPDDWEIFFDDFLIVQNEKISVDVFGGHAGVSRRPKTSTLALTGRPLHVDSRGQLLDRLALRISGDWGKEGLANEVPLEFQPGSK